MSAKVGIAAALIGAAALGAIAVGFSNAQSDNQSHPVNQEEFDAAQEQAIQTIVREYLMEHPEVLIEAINTYAANERANAAAQAEQFARENLAQLLDNRHGYTTGANPAAAKVAVIELFDYHCSFCKRASGLVQDLTQADPAVKVVFREFPILRDESDYAAEFALASRPQGKYVDMHFALMNTSGVLTKKRVKDIAKEKGVDVAAVEESLKDASVREAIDETRRIAAQMAVDGTPAFIVASLNGEFVEVISGFRADDLTAAIANAKNAAGK